jgi:predicted outer membrane protein
MKLLRGSVLFATLLSLACASAPPPAPNAVPARPLVDHQGRFRQREARFRAGLRRDPHHEQKPLNAPVVDVEAARVDPVPEHRSINPQVALFSNEMHGDIQTYLTRSSRYRALIEKTLAEHDLPKGIAYLPVIESGYSPT